MFLSQKRLEELIEGIEGKKIAVIGDSMLDRYLWGGAERISPEAPVPIIDLKREEIRIGGAANVADNLMLLGAKPILISIIGNDVAGEKFLEHAAELGLDTNCVVQDKSRPTTEKSRIIARNQQVCRLDKEVNDNISKEIEEILIKIFYENAPSLSAIILSDYGKGVITPRLVAEVVDYCCNASALVTVDPKEEHWEYYAGVDLIKPNHQETSRATGIRIDSDKSLERAGWALLEKTSAKSLLVTTGEHGMSLFERGKAVAHLPTIAREVFDVTGAGDTVIAAATAALAAGAKLEEAAIIANHAAGIVVAEVGTAAATPDDIRKSMERERIKNER